MKHDLFKKEIIPVREKLFLTAFRLLENKDDAEDAVQETMIRLWNLRDELEKYDNRIALAMTITKNQCIDKIRSRGKTVSIETDLYRRASPDNPYLQLERKNTEDVLKAIIEDLPALQKAIITLKDIEGYELAEIAEITGSSNEAIRVNLSRARKKVREDYIRLTTQ
jgi:RNA polymerase sigma-70 factor (ECF subfamily)